MNSDDETDIDSFDSSMEDNESIPEESPVYLDNLENIRDIQTLEKITNIKSNRFFDAECVRKRANWSKANSIYKFDSPDFNPKKLEENMRLYSPKLYTLLSNIEKLDAEDMKTRGKLHKHFIFSDLKSGSAGAKMIAAGLISKGFVLGYKPPTLNQRNDNNVPMVPAPPNTPLSVPMTPPNTPTSFRDESIQNAGANPKKKAFGKIDFVQNDEIVANKNNIFYLLSSVSVYDQPISVKQKKTILQKMNQRPENIYGENARIIVMDSGYKEGIDLFDIKYVHIFEPQINSADQKQVIGRGTRTCGQKGLEFHPTLGWPLHVFIYDIDIPTAFQESMMNSSTLFDLYLKSLNIDIRLIEFTSDLERVSIIGSVDYELNRQIHDFSIQSNGGAKLRVRKDLPIIDIPSQISELPFSQEVDAPRRMKFQELREYIRKEYMNQYAWTNIKMENLCSEKGGASHAITYTPTQDFIRHYFTPKNPVKGMLLWNSVGTGKTCSAIAAASSSFEKEGYTILWVTRTTLKNDIWKNMFDQVCNENIRERMEKGEKIPEEQQKRMRLLSKSWSIRPMSYKQFSNLVSKQNIFYKALVKKNGEIDPLRKTLLIIDEAHKLYGGEDLSSLERPDMNALKKAIQNSYEISGANSVRLLLMTATPITGNPMELIKILNLCKPESEKMPEFFDDFSKVYLDEAGKFTQVGENRYLDDIAGYISYLNREKDARQFAQPVIQWVHTPIVDEKHDDIKRFDKSFLNQYVASDIKQLKTKIEETAKKMEGDLSELDITKFASLNDKCLNVDEKYRKSCEAVVRKNVKELLQDAKIEVQRIRGEIKTIRDEIKNKNVFKRESLNQIKENLEKYPEQFARFKESVYYQIKNTCGKTVKDDTDLRNVLKTHPLMVQLNGQLEEQDMKIAELTERLRDRIVLYNKKVNDIRDLLKTDLNEVEKCVSKSILQEETKNAKYKIQMTQKEIEGEMENAKKTRKNLEKIKKKKTAALRKTLKKHLGEERSVNREMKSAEKKMRKTLRKQGKLREELKNDFLKRIYNEYSQKIDDELVDTFRKIDEEREEKTTRKTRKNIST